MTGGDAGGSRALGWRSRPRMTLTPALQPGAFWKQAAKQLLSLPQCLKHHHQTCSPFFSSFDLWEGSWSPGSPALRPAPLLCRFWVWRKMPRPALCLAVVLGGVEKARIKCHHLESAFTSSRPVQTSSPQRSHQAQSGVPHPHSSPTSLPCPHQTGGRQRRAELGIKWVLEVCCKNE